MRKIRFIFLMVAIAVAALHSKAAGAPLCPQAHTTAFLQAQAALKDETQQKLEPKPSSKNPRFQGFNDALDLRAYNEIWAKTTKEMLKEIETLPKEDQDQIKAAAQSLQDYMQQLTFHSIKWKKWNRTKEHSGVYKIRSRMEDLKEDLRIGNNAQVYGTHGYAVSIYKKLFHDVESSYLKLKTNLAELDALQRYGRTAEDIQKENSVKVLAREFAGGKGTSKSDALTSEEARTNEIRKENRILFRVFGRKLEEYMAVRLYLEGVAKEDPLLMSDPAFTNKGRAADQLASPKEIAAYAKDVLTQLGVSGSEQLSPFLGLPRKRISLDEMYSLYVSTPEIQIEQIKEDYYANRGLFFRSHAVNNIFVNYIRKTINLFPNQGKARFVRHLLGVFTNFIERRHLELRYLRQIQDIVYAENDIGAQYEILRRQNNFSDLPDEFLITFARVSFYSKQWSELRKYAEQVAQETGSLMDSDFVERMKKAEVEAVNAGTFSPGKADTKATIVKDSYSLITTALVLYFHDPIVNTVMDFFGLVTTTAKFVCSSCNF